MFMWCGKKVIFSYVVLLLIASSIRRTDALGSAHVYQVVGEAFIPDWRILLSAVSGWTNGRDRRTMQAFGYYLLLLAKSVSHNVLVLFYIPWCVCSIRYGFEDLRHPPCILAHTLVNGICLPWFSFQSLVKGEKALLVLEYTDECVHNLRGC